MDIAITGAQRKAARVAGFFFLFTSAIVVYVNFAIHDRLNVAGDAARTAQNILAHETLFRFAAVCDLAYCAGLLVLITALYVVLEPAGRGVALLAAFWRLAYAIMWLVMTIKLFDALRLMHGADFLRVFEPAQLQALAKLDLTARFDRYYGGLIFFALSSTACAYLWWRSRYIPRWLAGFGLIGSAWCVICAFVFLVNPDFSKVVNLWWFDTALGLFEIVLGVWLLARGIREPQAM